MEGDGAVRAVTLLFLGAWEAVSSVSQSYWLACVLLILFSKLLVRNFFLR